MKKLLILLLAIVTGCGEEDDSYSLREDLINGVWVIVNDSTGDYSAADFIEGGSVVLYEGYHTSDDCIQEEEVGLFVLDGNELSLTGGSVIIEISSDVLTVDENGNLFTYDRYTDNDFEVLLDGFCE